MKAKDLIGRFAIRTKPVFINKYDTSFTSEKCLIKHADDSHVVIESYGKEIILNNLFLDNWKPYSDIEQGLSKLELQIKIGKIYIK